MIFVSTLLFSIVSSGAVAHAQAIPGAPDFPQTTRPVDVQAGPVDVSVGQPPQAAPGVSVDVSAPGASVSANAPGASVSANAPGASVSANAPGASVSANAPGASVSANAPGASAANPAPATPAAMPVTAVSPIDGLPGMMLLASTRHNPKLTEQAVNYRLYRYNPTTGTLEQLQLPAADQNLGSASGALSADGTKAVVNAGGQKIFLVDLTGRRPPAPIGDALAPLSFTSQDAYFSIALSPDGSKVLASRPVPTGEQVISTATGAASPVAFIPPGGQPPAFSPDGQWLAFVYTAPGSGAAKAIFTAPADGSADPSKVTPDDVYESAAVWTPDGNGIAYVALDGSWQVRLWSFAASSQQTVYQAPDGYFITDVAVSPDGAWVGYSVYNPKTLQRFVQVSNVSDPTNVVVVPHDDSFADRILGWVAGPSTAASVGDDTSASVDDGADTAGVTANGDVAGGDSA